MCCSDKGVSYDVFGVDCVWLVVRSNLRVEVSSNQHVCVCLFVCFPCVCWCVFESENKLAVRDRLRIPRVATPVILGPECRTSLTRLVHLL